MIRLILFLVLLIFSLKDSFAQFYSSGTEPASLQWEAIEDKGIRIIYPKGFYPEANKLLNTFFSTKGFVNSSLRADPKKISVVLHNNSVLSNGFVTMGPRRMELVTTPPQNLEAQDWFFNLALHEYRHVAQIDRMNRGFTRFMTYLIGQSAYGLSALQIPLWVIEGDATVTETALSASGRGRTAEFEMYLKALHTTNKKISYEKAYFGSYKTHIPDRYELGYQLVGYGRLKYGKDIWKSGIEYAASNSFLPFSFNSGLKKQYSTSIEEIYSQAIDSLKHEWNKELNSTILSEYLPIYTEEYDNYVNYRFPSVHKNGTILLKEGIGDAAQIIQSNHSGHEKKLYLMGRTTNVNLSRGKNLITWSEIVPDIRWDQRNYSVIKILNLTKGKVSQVSYKSRLFSPAISANDEKIVAVEVGLNNENSLVIFEKNETWSQRRIIYPPDNEFLQYPGWFNDTTIIVTGTSNMGKNLYLTNIHQNHWEKLFGPVFQHIGQPVSWREYVLFKSDFTGTNDIFAIHIESKQLYHVTSSAYGASDPSVSSDTLYYSDYTASGYRPVKCKLDPAKWKKFEKVKDYELAEKLSKQEEGNLQQQNMVEKNYEGKTYNKANHLFNFHSWLPFYVDPDFENLSVENIKPGIILLSQNLLNTVISSIGLSYDEKTFFLHPRITYQGFYPVFDFSARMGGLQKVNPLPENIQTADTNSIGAIISLRTYIPFNFSNGSYYKFIQPELKINYENSIYYDAFTKSGIMSLQYKLFFSRYQRSSMKHIYPNWGQAFSTSFTHTPVGNIQYGTLFHSSLQLYFPGLFKFHGFKTGFSLQTERAKYIRYLNKNRYYSFNFISLPRGYNYLMNFFKADEIAKMTFDYTFPLTYPDLSIPQILYLKRIRTTLFADVAYGKDVIQFYDNSTEKKTGYFHSTGLDFLADFHIFRFLFPVSAGFRFMYIENNYAKIGFLISINTDLI